MTQFVPVVDLMTGVNREHSQHIGMDYRIVCIFYTAFVSTRPPVLAPCWCRLLCCLCVVNWVAQVTVLLCEHAVLGKCDSTLPLHECVCSGVLCVAGCCG